MRGLSGGMARKRASRSWLEATNETFTDRLWCRFTVMAGLVPAIHVAQPHRGFAFDHVQPDSSPAPDVTAGLVPGGLSRPSTSTTPRVRIRSLPSAAGTEPWMAGPGQARP